MSFFLFIYYNNYNKYIKLFEKIDWMIQNNDGLYFFQKNNISNYYKLFERFPNKYKDVKKLLKRQKFNL